MSHLYLQDGIFWRDWGCRGGHILQSRPCAMATWLWRMWQGLSQGSLVETASPMRRRQRGGRGLWHLPVLLQGRGGLRCLLQPERGRVPGGRPIIPGRGCGRGGGPAGARRGIVNGGGCLHQLPRQPSKDAGACFVPWVLSSDCHWHERQLQQRHG